MPNWNKSPREFDDELCLNQVMSMSYRCCLAVLSS